MCCDPTVVENLPELEQTLFARLFAAENFAQVPMSFYTQLVVNILTQKRLFGHAQQVAGMLQDRPRLVDLVLQLCSVSHVCYDKTLLGPQKIDYGHNNTTNVPPDDKKSSHVYDSCLMTPLSSCGVGKKVKSVTPDAEAIPCSSCDAVKEVKSDTPGAEASLISTCSVGKKAKSVTSDAEALLFSSCGVCKKVISDSPGAEASPVSSCDVFRVFMHALLCVPNVYKRLQTDTRALSVCVFACQNSSFTTAFVNGVLDALTGAERARRLAHVCVAAVVDQQCVDDAVLR